MTRFYQVDSDQDIRDEAELERLIRTMHRDPESEVVYYFPRSREANLLIQGAIDRGLIAEGEHEFFYFRREGPTDRNFVRIERNQSDETSADVIFGYEKSNMMWARAVAAGEMFVRTTLRLTDRMRRHLDAELSSDRNPIEAKPGAFGFRVDLFKLWKLVRSWWRRYRRSVSVTRK